MIISSGSVQLRSFFFVHWIPSGGVSYLAVFEFEFPTWFELKATAERAMGSGFLVRSPNPVQAVNPVYP